MIDGTWFNSDTPVSLDFPWLSVEVEDGVYIPGLIRLRRRLCGISNKFRAPEVGEHSHSVYHFLFCSEGGNSVSINGRIRSFARGDFLMINPGVPHNIDPHDNTPARYFAFTFCCTSGDGVLNLPWTELILKLTGLQTGEDGMLEDTLAGEDLFSHYLRDLTEPVLPDRAVLGRLFMEFLLTFYGGRKRNAASIEGRIGMLPAEKGSAYIRDNYSGAITLSEICGFSGLSKGHFIEEFKKQYGKTPMDYLTEYRIERASLLLCSTNQSQQEIADLCGFSSDSYFSKVFRSRKGMSPGRYRTTIRD